MCVKKNIQLTRRIIEATLIRFSLVMFFDSVCPKINIVPHDGKKVKIWEVDAWKHIDLVVYYNRIVYNFFHIIGRVIEATLCFGIKRVIPLTDLSTDFIKPKIKKSQQQQKYNKIMLFLVHLGKGKIIKKKI